MNPYLTLDDGYITTLEELIRVNNHPFSPALEESEIQFLTTIKDGEMLLIGNVQIRKLPDEVIESYREDVPEVETLDSINEWAEKVYYYDKLDNQN